MLKFAFKVDFEKVVLNLKECWKYDAFSAFKDENGNIFGRGTQDMKCVGIQYLEAIRELKKKYKQLKRNIHLLFVPGKVSKITKSRSKQNVF